jgi:hypothetical protein
VIQQLLSSEPNRPVQVSDKGSVWLISLLLVIALISRAIGAMILPNPEQDGYSYAEIIGQLTKEFVAGRFHVSSLYGFWLPLFQVVSAIVNVGVHDPIISGKIVNAVCGAVSLVLVFVITRAVTGNRYFALLAFGLMLLDPLHVLYSAACMTDIPHACIVLASLWCVLRRHWLGAAVLVAIAATIRLEPWALIVAVPLLQFLEERRVSISTILIMLIAPLGWLAIAWIATGDPLDYFADRARYHAEYIQFHPARSGFEWRVIKKDVGMLLAGANKSVFIGAIVAAVIGLISFIRERRPNLSLMAPITYGAGILGLLVLAYLTKSQPVWLPRYGLIFLAIGLPLFAWSLQWLLSQIAHRAVKFILVLAIVGICMLEMWNQLPGWWKVREDYTAQQQIAEKTVTELKDAPPATRCFSDDVAVRVLSGLPPETFVRSAVVPESARQTREEFIAWMRANNITRLIYFPTEDSLPAKFLPELSHPESLETSTFEEVAFARSSFGPNIWLYRLR